VASFLDRDRPLVGETSPSRSANKVDFTSSIWANQSNPIAAINHGARTSSRARGARKISKVVKTVSITESARVPSFDAWRNSSLPRHSFGDGGSVASRIQAADQRESPRVCSGGKRENPLSAVITRVVRIKLAHPDQTKIRQIRLFDPRSAC